MNIKSTLLTTNLSLIIAGIACLTTLPVHADAFQSAKDKYEDFYRRNQQNQQNQQSNDNQGNRFSRFRADNGEDEDDQRKRQAPGKGQADKPTHEERRNEQPRQDRNDGRSDGRSDGHDHARDWNKAREKQERETHRSPIKHPPQRIENSHRERPPTSILVPAKRPAKPIATIKRPRHHIVYPEHIRHEYRYIRGPWYYNWYINPLPYHYYPIGHRINVLPSSSIRIVISGMPYFYYTGVFYRPFGSGYIVVGAPIGAFVSTLPDGFIALTLGVATYYYINDTYYLWDDHRSGYVVVKKPKGADEAIKKATKERLVVYPNKGQDEEQQAKDRYECHRWAVTEAGFDPTLEEEEFSADDRDVYRRALAACLEGRDYTVK